MSIQSGRRSTVVLTYGVIVLFLFSTGCAAVMAARQPQKRDLTVLEPGTPRNAVIAELGTPRVSEEKNGEKEDLYVFTQGYSTEVKALRVMLHVAGDFFTVFLWEFVGMPIEVVANGKKMEVQAVYDQNNTLKSATELEHG